MLIEKRSVTNLDFKVTLGVLLVDLVDLCPGDYLSEEYPTAARSVY